MDKRLTSQPSSGFTVLELLAVLAIVAISLALSLPALKDYFARQHLKQVTASITTYIQSARNMSASTECQSIVNFQKNDSSIRVSVQLERDIKLKGCSLWFEASGNQAQSRVTIRSGTIANAELERNTSFVFQGVSGSLNSYGQNQLDLRTRGKAAKLNLDGIGNGVLEYVQ